MLIHCPGFFPPKERNSGYFEGDGRVEKKIRESKLRLETSNKAGGEEQRDGDELADDHIIE